MLKNGHKIKVQFERSELQVAMGTTVAEVLGQIYIRDHEVIGATLNYHLVSLLTQLDGDSVLEAGVPCNREGQPPRVQSEFSPAKTFESLHRNLAAQ